MVCECGSGVALSLSLVCLYLMNLRTLGVRSDASVRGLPVHVPVRAEQQQQQLG